MTVRPACGSLRFFGEFVRQRRVEPLALRDEIAKTSWGKAGLDVARIRLSALPRNGPTKLGALQGPGLTALLGWPDKEVPLSAEPFQSPAHEIAQVRLPTGGVGRTGRRSPAGMASQVSASVA